MLVDQQGDFRAGNYGSPQLSRQNQKPQGKNKIPHGKPKTSLQNRKPHGKNKIPHDKTKKLTAKPNTSQQNRTKYLTAKVITHGKTKVILLLL